MWKREASERDGCATLIRSEGIFPSRKQVSFTRCCLMLLLVLFHVRQQEEGGGGTSTIAINNHNNSDKQQQIEWRWWKWMWIEEEKWWAKKINTRKTKSKKEARKRKRLKNCKKSIADIFLAAEKKNEDITQYYDTTTQDAVDDEDVGESSNIFVKTHMINIWST